MNYLINIMMFIGGFVTALILRKIMRKITIKRRQNKFAMYNYGSTIDKEYEKYKEIKLLNENNVENQE